METILERIQQMAINENIAITALERAIGASKGVLSRAINNKTDIQAKWLRGVVENYPQYSARWLLTGEGEMIASEPAGECEKCMIANFLREKDQKICEQAEEIGRLKERIYQLERKGESVASGVPNTRIANAG